jgi:N-acetyl-gamma-glutamyl-phosphate reductase
MDIEPVLRFVPHSGPFARGIHMTLQAQLTSPVSETELRQALRDFYADHRFVQVVDGTPHLKDVVGSNYCHLGVAVDGNSLVLLSVIDNLIKGAAGGAMQWMNRQLGFDEYAGLNVLGPAWI